MPAIWVDAQLSPAIAGWIPMELGVQAHALRDLGLRDADDTVIFMRARDHNAIILVIGRQDASVPRKPCIRQRAAPAVSPFHRPVRRRPSLG